MENYVKWLTALSVILSIASSSGNPTSVTTGVNDVGKENLDDRSKYQIDNFIILSFVTSTNNLAVLSHINL